MPSKLLDFANFYTLDSYTLGRGSFGEVRKATLSKNTKVVRAVKIINKIKLRTSDYIQLQEEASILNQFDHPNIIRIYGIYQDYRSYYFVTQLLSDNLFARYHKELPLS